MIEKPEPKFSVPKMEEVLLRFWRERDIFWKSVDQRKGKERYVFYDGPPFATGTPHYGHILASAIKDAVPRYQTMRGKYVERRWGWDCHGLPIENIVEKDLKISEKKEIETFGIGRFNDHARGKVLAYAEEWKKTVERMARWIDFDGSYKTMDNTYIESVWWALGELQTKGLVYEGTRVLPYCPRCETPIAQSEIAMDSGSYKEIADLAVYVKFFLVDDPNTSLLTWTTTPWSLPGNTAVGVRSDLDYVKVAFEGEYFIVAASRVAVIFSDGAEVVETFSGAQLLGRAYRPPFDYFVDRDFPHKDRAWKVYAADYVSPDEGSGLVHLAPAFGAEDMELAQRETIPAIWHVDATGRFSPEVTDLAGEFVKPKNNHQQADIEIVKLLASRKLLFKKEKIIHAYPHCFRCETPLYYYAVPAWFVRIQEIKPRLLELNQAISWVPAHLKEGRFAKSMAGAPDWNISRNRYWASPLPIWKCEDCHKTRFVRSMAELAPQLMTRNQFYFVRHGGSTKNAPDINDTSRDRYPLTAAGRREVAETAAWLSDKGVTKIIASPVLRTQETAAILADAIGVEVETDERLDELRTGIFEGHSRDEYHEFFADETERWRRRPPEGENQEDVFRRIREAIIDFNTHQTGQVIVIVSHGDPLWFMRAYLEGKNLPNELQVTAYPELGKMFTLPVAEIDLHRPWIDEIIFPCECQGTMRRVPEVFDCWFESGSMPYASQHYPFEHQDWLKDNFPGDFVAEYIAQTRTWFYYMHVLSTVLFDAVPFKYVVTTGNILAEDGQKMSKRLQNYPDPWLLFDRYGVDALRFYLLGSPVMKAEDINFSEKAVDEVFKKVILRLINVLAFYELYPDTSEAISPNKSLHKLDRWLVARLAETTDAVTAAMERYEIDLALRPLETFIDDLSVWYVRRSRERLKNQMTNPEASATLRIVLADLAKLLAPFSPFIAEHVFGRVKWPHDPESVHLADWPDAQALAIDRFLLDEMDRLRKLVELGHAERNVLKIKLRQPLSRATVAGQAPLDLELIEILADELNVKKIVFESAGELAVVFDQTLTPELVREGDMRELVRQIQSFRKEAELAVTDQAIVQWMTSDQVLQEILLDALFVQQFSTTKFQQFSLDEAFAKKIDLNGKTLYLRLLNP